MDLICLAKNRIVASVLTALGGGEARTLTDWSARMSRTTEKTSRQTQRNSARTARFEAVAKQQRRGSRRHKAVLVTASIAVIGLVGVSAWAIAGVGDSGSSAQRNVALTGLTTYPGLARDHVTGTVAYPQTPPVGGNHSGTWQNCGVYSAPIPNEEAVHSLEHGAMWITYRPGLPPSDLAALLDDVSGEPYALASPYPGLPSPIVASAWGVQLKLTAASDPRLKTFIDTYKSGSKAPEPGGECTGGTGNPKS